ncbi:MAG: hypothetical protein A2X46_15260 [Lentisphaerae bacterium GWF2_57_35]|nr:MAG: hypothetical protein A2X46_15260 [Lentisphaerae bacterium GWF2_57_35]
MAVSYLTLCVVYILFSGMLAAQWAHSIEELQAIETYKGIGFVVATSVFLFVFSWLLLHGIARREVEIARQREDLVFAERKALAGMLASSVAHDINNILLIITLGLERFSQTGHLSYLEKELLTEMVLANQNMKRLARRLMESGRANIPGEMTQINLKQLVGEALELGRAHCKQKGCRIEAVQDSDDIELRGNETIIQQMMLNLIVNAADAVPSNGGRIEVRVSTSSDAALIEVHDNGPGIPSEKRDQVFDAHFSTKRNHVGLGLLSVKACAAFHKGAVVIKESDLGGACFQVALPLKAAA